MSEAREADRSLGSEWHLDKRVPIALIATIVMQTMAAVWWAATMQSRIEALEKMLAASATTESRLVRLEQVTLTQSRTMDRIESKLDRVIERENGR